MQTIWQDLRYGARMLWKTPAVTLVAIIALTLGIGANTALFSVVNAVLLRSFPLRRRRAPGNRLGKSRERRGQSAERDQPRQLLRLERPEQCLRRHGCVFDRNVNLTGDGEPEEVPGQIATTNLFSVLGVNAFQGRTFTADDWQRRTTKRRRNQLQPLATPLRRQPGGRPHNHAEQSPKHNHRRTAG